MVFLSRLLLHCTRIFSTPFLREAARKIPLCCFSFLVKTRLFFIEGCKQKAKFSCTKSGQAAQVECGMKHKFYSR